MGALNQIIGFLVGNVSLKNSRNNSILFLKYIYLFLLSPALLLAFGLSARGGGFFGQESENIGIMKRVLLHISLIFFAFVLWGVIVNFSIGTYAKY